MRFFERVRTYISPRNIIAFSFVIWAMTEGLSIINAITSQNITFAWIAISVIGIYAFIRKLYKGGEEKASPQYNDLYEKFMLLICICLGMVTFILAIIIVPNNWDSMTYNLSRVANWIQNCSVRYYPTYIDRQLYYSSFTEYIILHICLLCRNDLYVNLVQWFGYIVSSIMIYKIINQLGCNNKSALIASLSFMLLPLAIAESVTTQVDLVASMWVLIFYYYILLIGQKGLALAKRENIINLFCCVSAVGFGYLTKSSICFLMPVGLLWLLVVCLKRREKVRNIIMSVGMATATLLVLLFPGFARNFKSTGNIFAFNKVAGNLMFHAFSIRLFILNICKNITLEVVGERQPSLFWKATMKLSGIFGVDIENAEISAYNGFSNGVYKNYGHDTAGAREFMVIIFVMLFCVLVRSIYLLINHKLEITLRDSFVFSVFVSASLLFAVIRWQPWGVRLLFPALPLFCICLGYNIDKIGNKHSLMMISFFMIFCFMLPSALGSIKYQYKRYGEAALKGNGRFDLYFANRPVQEQYKSAIEYVEKSGARDIGILTDGDSYEYPIWVALKKENTTLHPIVLEEPIENWHPQYIISVCRGMEIGEVISYGEQEFECINQWNYENDYGICSVLRAL